MKNLFLKLYCDLICHNYETGGYKKKSKIGNSFLSLCITFLNM